MSTKVQSVDVDLLEIKDELHRTKIDISSLVESIQTTGQINPIIVKPIKGGKYQVIAGRRRTSALKSLQALTGEKQKALVVIKELDKLQEELITIDENIMRAQLTDAELDEALYRRKQIYEELHPETKQHVAGAAARHEKKATPSFTSDAAKKLKINKRTIEKSVARAAKAADEVKKARASGKLSQSKVDYLVTLPQDEQIMLLPLAIKKDVKETKALVERARKIGAKALVLRLEEEEGPEEELSELKTLVKEITRVGQLIDKALKHRKVFRSRSRFDLIREIERVAERLKDFTDFQRAALGARVAIRRRGSDVKVIKASR